MAIETYTAQFKAIEGQLSAVGPQSLHALRKRSLEAFTSLGFPGLRHENWRGTRVKPIAEIDFGLAQAPVDDTESLITRDTFDDHGCYRAVVVNGQFSPTLSRLPQSDGVIALSLSDALATHPHMVEPFLGSNVDLTDNAFAAWNTAFVSDGVFLHIASGKSLDKPLHVVFVSVADQHATVAHPRLVVVAEDNADCTLIESHVGTGQYLNNVVSEFHCGKNANVVHTKLQREQESSFHIATQAARLERDARFSTESVSLGGSLVRNDIYSHLDGEGIDCRVDGLYLASGTQHVDNHTYIRHAQPNCHSFELYKGILDGRARAVFNGRINVDQDAQKTDAKQSNSCILLSDNARINTNPQLEIFADDVKCTHGATVGQLDENSVYYMQARGIPKQEARQMLVHAFANEVLERITVAPVRERLESDLYSWLGEAVGS